MALITANNNSLEDFDDASKLTYSEMFTSTDPAITEADQIGRLYDARLGLRARFHPTFYIHDVASSATYQNDAIDFKEGGGAELNATLSPGQYDADELAVEIKTQLEAAGGLTYTVTWSDTTRKFTIAPTTSTVQILWLTGTNNTTGAFAALGWSKADTADAASVTSDGTADNMGHWLKIDNSANTLTSACDIAACFKPRYANADGDTTTPASKDFELQIKVYHDDGSGDLGNDPRLWQDSGVLLETWTLYDQNNAPPTENEWYVNVDSSPRTWSDFNWIYIEILDADDASNPMNWLELGYLYLGPKSAISAAAGRLYCQSQQRPVSRTLIEPTARREAHSSTVYATSRPQYWQIGLPFVAWDETSWEDILALYRTHGRITPALWVLDDSTPNGNSFRNSYWAVFRNDFENSVQELDYYNFNIVLRQVVD